jgi:hypothetical protein
MALGVIYTYHRLILDKQTNDYVHHLNDERRLALMVTSVTRLYGTKSSMIIQRMPHLEAVFVQPVGCDPPPLVGENGPWAGCNTNCLSLEGTKFHFCKHFLSSCKIS